MVLSLRDWEDGEVSESDDSDDSDPPVFAGYGGLRRGPPWEPPVQYPADWHGGEVAYDEIAVSVLPDETAILAALRAGGADFALINDPLVASLVPPLRAPPFRGARRPAVRTSRSGLRRRAPE